MAPNEPKPPVMNPILTPFAAWISLFVTIAAVIAVSGPAIQKLLEPATPLAEKITTVAGMIVALAGPLHLSLSRSTISRVDNPPT
jgi:hypothetical protein